MIVLVNNILALPLVVILWVLDGYLLLLLARLLLSALATGWASVPYSASLPLLMCPPASYAGGCRASRPARFHRGWPGL